MDETHLIAESRLRVTLFGTFKLDAPDGEEVVVPGKRARSLKSKRLRPSLTADTLVEAVWVVALEAGAVEGVEDRTSVVSI